MLLSPGVGAHAAPSRAPVLPPGSVATVAGKPVSDDTFLHWYAVAAHSAAHGGELPAIDSPAGVVAARQALGFLVQASWAEQQARRSKVRVSRKAVLAVYLRDKKINFKTEAAFQRFLAEAGETVADIKFRVRQDILNDRLQRHAMAKAHTRRGRIRALERYLTHFLDYWPAHTVCAEPYSDPGNCGSTAPLPSS